MAAPALAPPTATVDENLVLQYQQEMAEAQNAPLPNDDDDDEDF